MRNILFSTAVLLGSALGATAETIEIQMLNENEAGEKMVFSQELIRAEVGDVIRFVPTDRSHNAQSVDDTLPDNQEGFKGRINAEVEYTVTETGLTAIVCLPHQAMGMVAVVLVGDDVSNADQLLEARIPGQGKQKIEALVEEARASVPAAEAPADQTG